MVFLVNGLVGLVELLCVDECKSPLSHNTCSTSQQQQVGAQKGQGRSRTQRSDYSQRKHDELHLVR